ncbi:MAG TPA: GNAT family N-acetyltransferase [Candidatus Limnocylindria bacterium]|nr:GNAT family N-acetyltransferase [Candidatus Limnocylindria bacterium]
MKTSSATEFSVEPIDLERASDEELRPFVEFAWQRSKEEIPEDPVLPFEAMAARMRMTSPMFVRRRWAVWAAPRKLAATLSVVRSTQDNLNNRDVDIEVGPEHRRRGIGRRLLATAVDACGDEKGLTLMGWTTSRVPSGAAFAERIGAKPGLRMRNSQLDLRTIDRDLISRWAAIDPTGYRIEFIDSDIPDRLMDNVVTAIRAINTMPREDLQMEDWKVTPETLREWERMGRARGQQRRMAIVIEEATGASAAFTEIFFDPRVPGVLHQGGTATIEEHRGKGIGKWIKARMAQRVLDELPGARYIRTDNAGTNAAMLSINVAMGFVPVWESIIWQIPLEDARRSVR